MSNKKSKRINNNKKRAVANNAAAHKKRNTTNTNTQNKKNINPLSEREIALRKQAQKRKMLIKRRRKITSFFLVVVICAVGIMLSLTVFFHIGEIEVEGNVRYSDNEILEKISLKIQDNLFLSDLKKVEQEITDAFPYVGTVKVTRKIPSTILITVIETSPAYALLSDDGDYMLINYQGRILEEGISQKPINLPIISGVTPNDGIVGEIIKFANEDIAGIIEELIVAIENSEISLEDYIGELTPNSSRGEITLIDLSDILNIKLVYGENLILQLGTASDFDYKLKFAKETIDKLPYGSAGTIDLSTVKKATYSPESAVNKETNDDSDDTESTKNEE